MHAFTWEVKEVKGIQNVGIVEEKNVFRSILSRKILWQCIPLTHHVPHLTQIFSLSLPFRNKSLVPLHYMQCRRAWWTPLTLGLQQSCGWSHTRCTFHRISPLQLRKKLPVTVATPVPAANVIYGDLYWKLNVGDTMPPCRWTINDKLNDDHPQLRPRPCRGENPLRAMTPAGGKITETDTVMSVATGIKPVC